MKSPETKGSGQLEFSAPPVERQAIMRDGRSLEAFVRSVEAFLLGEGFHVVTRSREHDSDGLQTAEIDVRATGQLGSSSIHWLFECRDRPSSGPADIGWIEQLVARRDRLNADKIFAVSTTGFSPSAQRYAEARGVVLRAVISLDNIDIREAFVVQSATLLQSCVDHFDGIELETTDPEDKRDVAGDSRKTRVRPHGNRAPWLSLWAFVNRLAPAPFDEPPAPDRFPLLQDRVLVVDAPHDLDYGGEISIATRMLIRYAYRTDLTVSRAVTVRLYAEGDREIAREGVFDFGGQCGTTRLRIQIIKPKDGVETVRIVSDEPAERGHRYQSYAPQSWRGIPVVTER